MITVERFSEERHRAMIDAWNDARGMSRYPADLLPRAGFIVADVAAMWLYVTDSKLGFVESVISSPHTTTEQRGEALEAIHSVLEEHARALGMRALVGSSRNPRLLRRVREQGGYYVSQEPLYQIIKELTP